MQNSSPPAAPQTPGGDAPGVMIRIGSLGREIATDALRLVRVELEAELSKASRERGKLQAQLERKGGDDPALEARIDKLDADVIRLQSGISEISEKIVQIEPGASQGPRGTPGTRPPDFPFDRRDSGIPEDMIISILGIIFIGFPLAIAFARIIWKRAGNVPSPSPALVPDTSRRFDHLEQSVDAIAIEVERISENQRYLTKLLSEGRQVAVGSGDPSKSH
jgi:hypothetical protein